MNKLVLPQQISSIRRLYNARIQEKLNQSGVFDLDASYGNIIHVLLKHDKLTMKELAEKIGRDASTLTVLARKLESKGYIFKIDNEKDMRSKYIALTDKGKSLESDFHRISYETSDILWKGFSDEEAETTMKNLKRIWDNLDETNK